MRVLVTGGAGFIGSIFVRHILTTHPTYSVTVYDALTYAGLESRLEDLMKTYPGRLQFVKGNVCDAFLVGRTLSEHHIDAVVNFAAESHVDRSLSRPAVFVQSNILGTAVVLDCARHHGIQRFVHISTDEVYGDISFGSVAENALLAPRNPYAASKAAADQMVMAYHAAFGLNVSISRSSNNYGPWQHPEKFIAGSILRVLSGQTIRLHGDGLHMRDWIWVYDNCTGIDLVLHHGNAGDVYNIGAGELHTNRAIALTLLRLAESDATSTEYVPDRQANDRRYLMDTTKIRALGWAPSLDLAMGLSQTIDWYRKMRHWWRPLLDSAPSAQPAVEPADRPMLPVEPAQGKEKAR